MATYKKQRYLFMSLDPVHIGTGGYRLGRVDNSIVREPGTKVPKIPGTSLHGAARSYASRLFETVEAAGQNQQGVNNPDNNPVCYTFGYIKKESNEESEEENTKTFSGVINVFDAHIVLFPVHSMIGPVWVSTAGRLKDAGCSITGLPETITRTTVYATFDKKDQLNLGWLMVNMGEKITIMAPPKWTSEERWKAIKDSIVIVHESIFSQIVNSNLEVRTSVAIDPKTGAAIDKALFTYEAIPRATFLTSEVVLDDYRGRWPLTGENQTQTPNGNPLPGGQKWSSPLDVLKSGLEMIEWLGVGGMGTRGFGRLAIVGDPLEQNLNQEVWE